MSASVENKTIDATAYNIEIGQQSTRIAHGLFLHAVRNKKVGTNEKL